MERIANSARLVELNELPAAGSRLQDRVLSGEYFLVRGAMKQLGLLEPMKQASLTGIRTVLGGAIASDIEKKGFEKTHEAVAPADIPAITDAAYKEMARIQPGLLRKAVPAIFGSDPAFYFEYEPNVRFHIPYDLAAAHRELYAEFGKRRGDGKVTAHGPHRDSWLGCPTNAVNIWVAVGPVDVGNGLLVYPEAYQQSVDRGDCYLGQDANPGVPTNVSMNPGDALVFHGDQLHASVLNRTSRTRYVVSFRLTLERPHFANGHYHRYVFAPLSVGLLERGPLSWLPEAPAKFALSYFRTRARQLRARAGKVERRASKASGPSDGAGSAVRAEGAGARRPAESVVRVDKLACGEIRALDEKTCVTRLTDGSVVRFSRHCTHEGGDLSLGYVDGRDVYCPWHGVPFDLDTGASPCKALARLKLHKVAIKNGRVIGA